MWLVCLPAAQLLVRCPLRAAFLLPPLTLAPFVAASASRAADICNPKEAPSRALQRPLSTEVRQYPASLGAAAGALRASTRRGCSLSARPPLALPVSSSLVPGRRSGALDARKSATPPVRSEAPSSAPGAAAPCPSSRCALWPLPPSAPVAPPSPPQSGLGLAPASPGQEARLGREDLSREKRRWGSSSRAGHRWAAAGVDRGTTRGDTVNGPEVLGDVTDVAVAQGTLAATHWRTAAVAGISEGSSDNRLARMGPAGSPRLLASHADLCPGTAPSTAQCQVASDTKTQDATVPVAGAGAARHKEAVVLETKFKVAPRGDLAAEGVDSALGRVEGLALIILNFDLPPFTHTLWEQATALRICADGGANRLYDSIPSAFPDEDPDAVRVRFIPDVIKGDLDSIRPEVHDFYTSKGAQVYNLSEDEDTTDLHKCLQHLVDYYGLPQTPPPKGVPAWPPSAGDSVEGNASASAGKSLRKKGGDLSKKQVGLEILVLGGLGGRLDHEFGNINVLHRFRAVRIVLLSSYSLLTLLPSGRKVIIRPDRSFEGPHCGLIPLLQASEGTTTTGLRWNLNNLGMAFGGLVSTSNQLASDEVTVESDVPLLWTTEIRTH